MKKRIFYFCALLLSVIIVSCKKTDNLKSNVSLIVKTSGVVKSTLISSSGTATGASVVKLDTFLISLKNIEFGIDEEKQGLDKSKDSVIAEREFNGPFLIDVLSKAALAGIPIASGQLPDAAYDKIEFKLDRYTTDINSKLYNHTIFVTGTIDGKRMRMWYDGDYDFEIKFADTTLYANLTGSDFKLYLDFHIAQMLSALSSFDFSTAKDLNGNGIIEIGPNDTDGNNALAHLLIEAVLKTCTLDDQNDND